MIAVDRTAQFARTFMRAEGAGEKMVEATYWRLFESWKCNPETIFQLCDAIEGRIFDWLKVKEYGESMVNLYHDLLVETDKWATDHYKGIDKGIFERLKYWEI